MSFTGTIQNGSSSFHFRIRRSISFVLSGGRPGTAEEVQQALTRVVQRQSVNSSPIRRNEVLRRFQRSGQVGLGVV